MVETIYSKNPQDKLVHHPEPTCHDRIEIEAHGNDLSGQVTPAGQPLAVWDDNGELIVYIRCEFCTVIETKRLTGSDY